MIPFVPNITSMNANESIAKTTHFANRVASPVLAAFDTLLVCL